MNLATANCDDIIESTHFSDLSSEHSEQTAKATCDQHLSGVGCSDYAIAAAVVVRSESSVTHVSELVQACVSILECAENLGLEVLNAVFSAVETAGLGFVRVCSLPQDVVLVVLFLEAA